MAIGCLGLGLWMGMGVGLLTTNGHEENFFFKGVMEIVYMLIIVVVTQVTSKLSP